jgi:hypothetical protein
MSNARVRSAALHAPVGAQHQLRSRRRGRFCVGWPVACSSRAPVQMRVALTADSLVRARKELLPVCWKGKRLLAPRSQTAGCLSQARAPGNPQTTTATQFPPAVFARYMAWSARSVDSSIESTASSAATPKDPVMCSGAPPAAS